MAKGDASDAQNAITNQGLNAQTLLNQNIARSNMLYNQMQPPYQGAVDRTLPTYDTVMSGYQNFMGNTLGGAPGAPGTAIAGWQNMAQTGGFSPQDIQDMRARATQAVRGEYQTAQDELQRQKEIGGGYMPNYAAATAKMAREQGQQISNALTNTDAAIAQLRQQGKLYGLGGLTNAQLGAQSGTTGLFGTSPGMASVFGNQVLSANNQNLYGSMLQNTLANDIMRNTIAKAAIPSDYQQAMGNIGSTLGMGGTLGNILGKVFGGGGGAPGGGGGSQGGGTSQGGYPSFTPSPPPAGSGSPYTPTPTFPNTGWQTPDPTFSQPPPSDTPFTPTPTFPDPGWQPQPTDPTFSQPGTPLLPYNPYDPWWNTGGGSGTGGQDTGDEYNP